MRAKSGSGRSGEFIYVPLTPRDEAVRADPRYKIGVWLYTLRGSGFLGAAIFLALGIPIALVLGWRAGELGAERSRVHVTLTVMWLLAIGALYARWFARRQERAEDQRGYRFSVGPAESDAEIMAAKSVLLSRESTSEERTRAVELLISRGELTPARLGRRRGQSRLE